MLKVKVAAISLLLAVFLAGSASAKCLSTGFALLDIVNWGSIFPISIAGIDIVPSRDTVVTVDTYRSPICYCPLPYPPYVRIGITTGLWEPARYIETVKDPWCFPSVGMGSSGTSASAELAGTNREGQGETSYTFAQAHYFIFPIWSMLELLIDFACVESSGYDLAYMTELDPLWQDDGLAAMINPEAVLFGNPVAQLACIADSVSSNAGLSLSPLFWCMGSWGSAYPLTGHIAMADYVQANAAIAARFLYKMARELLVCDTNVNICGCMPTPIWVKHNYKMHISKPVRDFTAHPIGRSGLIWSPAKNPPYVGDNFVWMLYRRRNCCAF